MLKLNVLTPERKAVFNQEITEVTIPAFRGEITVLPGHSPLITTLGTGILKYKIKGEEKTHKAMISWGYCEVSSEAVNVLAEFMQTPEEVVVATAQSELAKAEKKLVSEILDDTAYEATVNDADRAKAAMSLVKH